MKSSKELKIFCINLEKALTQYYPGKTPSFQKDIDSTVLCSELLGITHRIQKNANPENVLSYLCQS